MHAELAELQAISAAAAEAELPALRLRLAELDARIASAVPVDPAAGVPDVVRFGANVRIRAPNGDERAYSIVGVDEANANAGRIAFLAPLAHALLGKAVGEVALVQTPHGEEELEIVGLDFDTRAGDASLR